MKTQYKVDMPELIDRAKQLDPQAFEALLDAYAPRVRGFLRRLVPARDVDDLTQEVFLRVVRTIGQYSESGRFDAWIFQIARHVGCDRLRKPERDVLLDDRSSAAAQTPQAGDRLEISEMTGKVDAALLRLPEAERFVILLRHFGRLTFEEISQMLDIPLGTALARAHRGLRKLRQWVEDPL